MTVVMWGALALVGGAGSVLRFVVDRVVQRRTAGAFPFGTLAVNGAGALILGVLTGLALNRDAALLAGTAAVGSFTTFSTWLLETQRVAEERQLPVAFANVVVSLAVGLLAAALGIVVGGRL
jgi:CrcB protein